MASASVPGTVNVFGNQPVFVQQASSPRGLTEKNGKRLAALGVVQLASGILAIAFQAAATGIENDAKKSTEYGYSTSEVVGCGIWCGALFVIAGLLGVLAGKRNGTSLIVACLVFSIVTSVAVWVLVGFAAANLSNQQYCPYRSRVISDTRQYTYYYYYYYTSYYGSVGSSSSRTEYTTYYYTGYDRDCSVRDGMPGRAWKAMDILLLILAILEFAIAVASATYCSRALSCCAPQSQPVFILQPSAGPPSTYLYGPSMQPMFLQQGPSIQGPVLTNHAMVAGPMGYSPGVLSPQLHPQYIHEAMPTAPVSGASTSSGYLVAPTTTVPAQHPVYSNDPSAPPNYYEIAN